MTLRIVLALLVSSALFVGCDSNETDGDDSTPVLLPLDVGNQWVMAFTRIDVLGGTPTETSTDTLRVVGDTTVAGERWAEIQGPTQLANRFLGGFYTNRDDGVWKWEGPSSDEAPHLLYKYPAEPGDTYALPPGYTDFYMEVLDTEASVETPAGSLLAYHYQFVIEEALGSPIPDDVGRLSRYLVPGQGFASFDGSYISLREEWETVAEIGWELIAFEGN